VEITVCSAIPPPSGGGRAATTARSELQGGRRAVAATQPVSGGRSAGRSHQADRQAAGIEAVGVLKTPSWRGWSATSVDAVVGRRTVCGGMIAVVLGSGFSWLRPGDYSRSTNWTRVRPTCRKVLVKSHC
jgi:hypothetical protein